MTWFRHRCWYCGLKTKAVDFIASGYPGGPTGSYQCVWENWEACRERRLAKYPWEAA